MKYITESSNYDKNGRGASIGVGDMKPLDIIKKYAPWFDMNEADIIFRGMYDKGDFYKIDPSSSTRVSANTSNYYTLLIDSFESWGEYPKRSNSIICGSSRIITKSYSYKFQKRDMYVVIPLVEDCEFSIAPVDDFWESFENVNDELSIDTLMEFNLILTQYFNVKETDTLIEIKDKINLKHGDMPDDYWTSFQNGIDKHGSVYEYFDYIFSPNLNGFVKIQYDNGTVLPKHRELWTDSECLLVRASLLGY